MRKWTVQIVGEIELNDRTKVNRVVDIEITEDDVLHTDEDYLKGWACSSADSYFQDLYPGNVYGIDFVSVKVCEES